MISTAREMYEDIRRSELYAIRTHLKAIISELKIETPDLGYLHEKTEKAKDQLDSIIRRARTAKGLS